MRRLLVLGFALVAGPLTAQTAAPAAARAAATITARSSGGNSTAKARG